MPGFWISNTTNEANVPDINPKITANNIILNNTGGINISDVNSTDTIIIGNECKNNTVTQIADSGTNTRPNGVGGTNNLALDDLNIIA